MTNEKRIKIFVLCAAVSAFIAGFLTLLISFTGMFGFNLFNLIDAAIFIGLGFGVLKKSRSCAIILFIYHIFNKFDMWTRTQDLMISAGFFSVFFAVMYLMGIMGTFAHHKLIKEKKLKETSL